MITWIELMCMVGAVVGAIWIATAGRPGRVDQLGTVSRRWITEHVDQGS